MNLTHALKSLTLTLVVACSAVANESIAPWIDKSVHDDVVYFAFASPARLERFDLETQTWLDSIDLAASPSTLYVNSSGIFYGSAREVRRLDLPGLNDAPYYNTAEDVEELDGDDDFLFVLAPSYNYGVMTSLRLSDGQFVDSFDRVYQFGVGLAVDGVSRNVYGINNRTSGYDISRMGYSETGVFDDSGSSTRGTTTGYNPFLKIAPDNSFIIRNTGEVYSLPDLLPRGNLAGAVEDVTFHGDGIAVVLRENQLIAFSSNLLPAGIAPLSNDTLGIEAFGENIFSFHLDAEQTSGINFEATPYSSISAARPDDPIDPAVIGFQPDDVLPVGNDTFLIVDEELQSVFRWEADSRSYTDSYRLLASPSAVTYSATLNRIYVGYSTGAINQIKLDEGKTEEEPFAIRPERILALEALDGIVFAVDPSGAWESFSTYDANGTLLNVREWSHSSQTYAWSSANRQLFYLRDGSSPGDLHRSDIAADGTISDDVDTPYHGDYSFRHPVRLSDDGSGVLTGFGTIFTNNDMTFAGSLANAITDAVSRNNRWITIREAATNTQLQTWTANNLFDVGVSIAGSPYRLLELNDGRLLVLTLVDGRLVYSIVDLDNGGTVTSSPILREVSGNNLAIIGGLIELTAVTEGDESFTYQWFRNSSLLDGETNATFRVDSATESDGGIYTVTVTGQYGSVSSDAITVVVSPPPPPAEISSQPQSAVVAEGEYFGGFYSWASYSGSFSIQWFKDGQAIAGATSSSFNPTTNGRVSESDYGNYWMVVTDDFGRTVTSETAVLSRPAKIKGYSLQAMVPMGGITITTVIRGGTGPVLMRALGPALPDTTTPRLANPVITIYDDDGQLLDFNVNWEDNLNSGDITDVSTAFGLPAVGTGSADAALYRNLPDGSYTILVEGESGGSGWVQFDFFSDKTTLDRNPIPYVAVLGPIAPDEPMVMNITETADGVNRRYIRGWGPATGRDTAAHDVAVVWSEDGGGVASNDDWSDQIDAAAINSHFSLTGLRSFPEGSSDAAMLTPNQSVSASQEIRLISMDDSSGVGLLEVLNEQDFNRYYRIPPIIPVGPEPVQAEVGGHAVFSSRGPSLNTTYWWSFNNIAFATYNSSTALLRNVSEQDEGNYRVTASNQNGTFTTIPVGLYVTSESASSEFRANHSATPFTPGGTATITVELHFPSNAASLGWSVEIPAGWTYVSGTGEPAITPASGATGVLEWGWIDLPTESPATFTFDIRSPSNVTTFQEVTGFGLMRADGELTTRLADPNPLRLRPGSALHRADMNENGRIELVELLRIIEIYNYRESSVRTGRYSLDASTSDGVRPGSGGEAHTWFHSADYDRNGRLGLAELLRVIEIYNYRTGSTRTGHYRTSSGTVDGFSPGP